jgi:homocysteine S-methyltransferase
VHELLLGEVKIMPCGNLTIATVKISAGGMLNRVWRYTIRTSILEDYEALDVCDMNPLALFLEKQGFVMLDGGLATEMERNGADLDDDLWSAKMLIEAPEVIRMVHSGFLKAGADIIASATYQASFEGFAAAGYSAGQAERLLSLGVDLALLARESFWSFTDHRRGRLRPLVAASIGPYGASLHDGSEYHGSYGLSRKQLADFHRPRLEVLAATEADIIAFETIPSLLEAEALLEVLAEYPAKPAWLSFSCKDGKHVSHGELFSECAALADQSDQVVAIGVNCTSPEHVSALLKSAAEVNSLLAVYPNSGEKWNASNNCWTGDGSGSMPVQEWYDLGARLIGGCCRTTTEDIAAMRAELVEYSKSEIA